jgi:hypothetical protein
VSWYLVVHEKPIRRDHSLRFAIVVGSDRGGTRAALSGGEGYDRKEPGERQQLLGEEHISVDLTRVGVVRKGEVNACLYSTSPG